MSQTSVSRLLPSSPWRRRATALGVAVIASLLTLDAAAAQSKRQVSFGLSVGAINASYCMYPVAIRAGFFAEEGLEVKVQPIPGAVTVVQTVLSGRLEIGGATPEPLLQLFERGNDELVLIYNFIRRPTGSIAVLDESPIRKLEDFRGKKLGAQSLASSNIILTNGVLRQVGIDPKTELTYLAVGMGTTALQAMRSGHVDGLAIFDSVYAQIEAAGAKLRYFVGHEQDRLFAVQFIARKDAVKADPDLYRKLGRAMAKATYFAQQNPEACIRMMWDEVQSSRAIGVSEEEQMKTAMAILTRRLTLLITPDSDTHGFGWHNEQDIATWNEFAVAGEIIKKKIDLTGRYTNEFVKDYNAFDRAEIARKAKAWKPN